MFRCAQMRLPIAGARFQSISHPPLFLPSWAAPMQQGHGCSTRLDIGFSGGEEAEVQRPNHCPTLNPNQTEIRTRAQPQPEPSSHHHHSPAAARCRSLPLTAAHSAIEHTQTLAGCFVPRTLLIYSTMCRVLSVGEVRAHQEWGGC